MDTEAQSEIVEAERNEDLDRQIEELLLHVYVGGGYTAPGLAHVLAAAKVRCRGTLLVARARSTRALLGTVVMVAPDDLGRRIAKPNEAELHLLAVASHQRGRGIGSSLVEACIAAAKRRSLTHMVLRTQPSMHAAHHIYERAGFVRNDARDMEDHGRSFLVYERSLEDQ